MPPPDEEKEEPIAEQRRSKVPDLFEAKPFVQMKCETGLVFFLPQKSPSKMRRLLQTRK